MHVTRLTTYPLKSGAPQPAARATVTPIGLAGDRRWTVLDADGQRVSAREVHALISVVAEQTGDGLRLSAPGAGAIEVVAPGPEGRRVPVTMSRLEQLILADEAASAWLSRFVGSELRLAYLSDELSRPIGPAHGGRDGEMMSLADAGPLLLVAESSVERLRDLVTQETGEPWLDREAATARFRPNVVVTGEQPFAEDSWWRIRIGSVTFRRGELCDRCVLTTLDPATLETGPEPIRTLARHRRWDGMTWFGLRLIPELDPGTTGEIGVADEVEVLEGM